MFTATTLPANHAESIESMAMDKEEKFTRTQAGSPCKLSIFCFTAILHRTRKK